MPSRRFMRRIKRCSGLSRNFIRSMLKSDFPTTGIGSNKVIQ
jgi:hypothetical protein